MKGSALDSVTFSLRQPDTDAAGEPLTLHVGRATPPPTALVIRAEPGRVRRCRGSVDAEPLGARMGRRRRLPLAPGRGRPGGVDRHRERDRGHRDGDGWMRRGVSFGAGAIVGVLIGAIVTLGIQARTLPASPGTRPRALVPITRPSSPETFLAWVPRGLPDGFAERVRRLPAIERITVVAEDNVWLSRSWTAGGELVDHPRPAVPDPPRCGRGTPRVVRRVPPTRRPHRPRRGGQRRGDPRFGLRLGARPRPRRDPRARRRGAHPDRRGAPR